MNIILINRPFVKSFFKNISNYLKIFLPAGEVQVSPTLQYSGDTYGSNRTGALGELCRAILAYSDAARAYFA